jgi:DNA-binding NarL/FixJ family response regulator
VEPEAALSVLGRVRFDAVLVSASLPLMTASTFVDELRREERLADVPVVVMAVTPRAAIDAIRAGARGCIRKPIDVGGVVSTLSPILKGCTRAQRRRRAPKASHGMTAANYASAARGIPGPRNGSGDDSQFGS